MKNVIYFIIFLQLISCKSHLSEDSKGIDDSGNHVPSWSIVGKANFTEKEVSDLSLAIDKNAVPYLAYNSGIAEEGKASVMKYNGGSWEYVGEKGFSLASSDYLEMIIGDNNIPYLVNIENVKNIEKNAGIYSYENNTWSPTFSGTRTGSVKALSFKFDKDYNPYLFFSYVERGILISDVIVYKSNEGDINKQWYIFGNNNTVLGGGSVPSLSMEIANDIVYAAYVYDSEIYVKKHVSTGWTDILKPISENKNITDIQVGYKKINIKAGNDGNIYACRVQDNFNDSGYLFTSLSVVKYNGASWDNVGDGHFAQIYDSDNNNFFYVYNNTPYVAFLDEEKKANVMFFDGTKWTTLGGSIYNGTAQAITISASSNGIIYIAYSNEDGNVTVMAYK